MQLRHLIFIRHSESLKSQEDLHGGCGLPLTNQGRLDAVFLAKFLESTGIVSPSTGIFASNLPQVIETAEIITDHIGTCFEIDDRIQNIHLGVLSGLSSQEAILKHPTAACQLEEWRSGKRPIDQVIIPGAETMQDFHCRILGYLCDIGSKEIASALLVGTRSVGVMVTNILLGQSVFSHGNYNRYRFDPSSVTMFEIDENGTAAIRFMNRTDFLPNPPSFPDR